MDTLAWEEILERRFSFPCQLVFTSTVKKLLMRSTFFFSKGRLQLQKGLMYRKAKEKSYKLYPAEKGWTIYQVYPFSYQMLPGHSEHVSVLIFCQVF